MVDQLHTTDLVSRAVPTVKHDQVACEIRPLDSAAELIESYRLRYEIYGALGYLRTGNRAELEIDAYDPASLPFGAFDPATGRMIGTLRLITIDDQPEYRDLVHSIVAELGDAALAATVTGTRPHSLPSIVSDQFDLQIDVFNTEGFSVQELSRTIVRPGFRGAGISRGLMEFGLAHAAQSGPAVLVGGCMPEHLPMYAKYGYLPLPALGLEHFDSVGQIANPLVCRTDRLPEPTRRHVDELLDAMGAGAAEHVLDIGPGAAAVYRFAPPRRPRRHTREW
jgi:predicted N-acetyltransferase YhbS